MKWLTILFTLFAFSALAADISGNWKATAEGPNGALERTFTFKQEGTKLTGETTSSFTGKSTITDGKVDGDTVTFTIDAKIGDQDVKLNYKGKIAGSEISTIPGDTSSSCFAGGWRWQSAHPVDRQEAVIWRIPIRFTTVSPQSEPRPSGSAGSRVTSLTACRKQSCTSRLPRPPIRFP